MDDSLILKLIEKMGIQKEHVCEPGGRSCIRKRPKVQGGQVYIGKDLNNVLIHAEDEAKADGRRVCFRRASVPGHDQICQSSDVRQLFREFGITRERFPAGAVHRPGQSESDQRQPGSDL